MTTITFDLASISVLDNGWTGKITEFGKDYMILTGVGSYTQVKALGGGNYEVKRRQGDNIQTLAPLNISSMTTAYLTSGYRTSLAVHDTPFSTSIDYTKIKLDPNWLNQYVFDSVILRVPGADKSAATQENIKAFNCYWCGFVYPAWTIEIDHIKAQTKPEMALIKFLRLLGGTNHQNANHADRRANHVAKWNPKTHANTHGFIDDASAFHTYLNMREENFNENKSVIAFKDVAMLIHLFDDMNAFHVSKGIGSTKHQVNSQSPLWKIIHSGNNLVPSCSFCNRTKSKKG